MSLRAAVKKKKWFLTSIEEVSCPDCGVGLETSIAADHRAEEGRKCVVRTALQYPPAGMGPDDWRTRIVLVVLGDRLFNRFRDDLVGKSVPGFRVWSPEALVSELESMRRILTLDHYARRRKRVVDNRFYLLSDDDVPQVFKENDEGKGCSSWISVANRRSAGYRTVDEAEFARSECGLENSHKVCSERDLMQAVRSKT